MVEQEHQTNNSEQFPEGERIEELHEEDGAIDINFEQSETLGNQEAQADDGALSLDLAELERQLASLQSELEDRTAQSMRIAADFENYRKRTSKEKEDLESQVKGNTITELLSVVDNFERPGPKSSPKPRGK